MDPADIIKQEARRVGFDLVGITTVDPPESASHFLDWIKKGYHGEMGYMARNVNVRLDPRALFPGACSAIVLGLNYAPRRLEMQGQDAKVSCYAWGEDYHNVMRLRMRDICRSIQERTGLVFSTRICVDTAPLLERDLAQRAGLGWIGKNTHLVNRQFGTWLFLGVILVDFPLPVDSPARDRCGACARCIEACPTGALMAPRILDARRCISYLTIETKGDIPRNRRPAIGNHLFGCDECLNVCPWNRFCPPSRDPAFDRRNDDILDHPEKILPLGDEEFRSRFASSPILRAGRQGLARNAAIVLGNRAQGGVSSLSKALSGPDALVRRHAAWALGQFPKETTAHSLEEALKTENDPSVRSEIHEALNE